MTSPLTIKVPHCYAEEWKCKLEEMCSGPKKHKRDEMEQHEPGDAAGGQIISGLKVGCLYDIGCQIHCAVHKWDFALEWREHLSWGVLIFHTYGHQWACQLWYHPCKDTLWGLLDGEGCERFWSELCHLISGLCVMGYHCHLFVLDMQIEHITAKKHFQLPRWLKEHLQHADSWLNSATKEIASQFI